MINKKAWVGITSVILLGIVMSVVIYAYYHPYTTTEIMGEKQAAIMESYSIGEQARRYSSDAAEIAAQQALYNLGFNGGHYPNPNSACDTNTGYYLLSGNCELSAEQIEDNFRTYFLDEFNKYLAEFRIPIHEETKESISPTFESEKDTARNLYDITDYDIQIKVENGNTVIEGFALRETITYLQEIYKVDEETGEQTSEIEDVAEIEETIESAIVLSSEKYMFEYVLDPHFKAVLEGIDINQLFSAAKASSPSDISHPDYKYYEYDTGKKLLVVSGGAIEKKPLIIRFAVQK